MLNLISNKKQNKKQNIIFKKLTIEDIEKYYFVSKNKKSLIGLEYERLSLDKNTFENAGYEKLEKIIKTFAQNNNWELIYDNNIVIGAFCSNSTSISLEPGCQLEISLAPKEDILSIENELNKIVSSLDKIASYYDVVFLGYGISPKSSVDDINLLKKARYQVMNRYLPSRNYGELSTKMMRQSAGMQINLDYKDEYDAYLKMKFFNLIMPFMTGLCANSPLENDKISNDKTLRAKIWRYTGSERCNLFYKNVFNFSFNRKNFYKKYINEILNVPMIFIERDSKIIEINGKITFGEFLKNGYLGYFATIDDYILHQSLCFPDVRMKKYIETRNHDSSSNEMALALCALYKGLVNQDFTKLLKKFNFLKIKDVEKYNTEAIKNGLNFKLNKNMSAWDVVALLFDISRKNLSSFERGYLEPIFEMIKRIKTSADYIIQCVTNSEELVEFLCY